MPPACPKPLKSHHLVWRIDERVEPFLRKVLNVSDLAPFKKDLGQMLCSYYNATDGRSKGTGISPVACGVDGARGFKVRWFLPGRGKSGGLRLAVLAICTKLQVTVVFAQERKDEPSDRELRAAFKAGS